MLRSGTASRRTGRRPCPAPAESTTCRPAAGSRESRRTCGGRQPPAGTAAGSTRTGPGTGPRDRRGRQVPRDRCALRGLPARFPSGRDDVDALGRDGSSSRHPWPQGCARNARGPAGPGPPQCPGRSCSCPPSRSHSSCSRSFPPKPLPVQFLPPPPLPCPLLPWQLGYCRSRRRPSTLTLMPGGGGTVVHIDQDTRTGGLADRAGALAAVDGGDSRSSRPDTADGRGALLLRLDRLPDGHPSSPRHANGTCKPADLGLYDIDEARPLTDAEHAEHVRDVRERLDKARADGLASHVTHTIDPRHTVWSTDRDAEHDAIIADLYAAASAVPCERQAILAGGLPGAGKTTVLARYAGIDRSRYLTINPDDIKVEMARRGMVPIVPGLTPMEATDLVHEESSHIAKRLASRAMRDGKNIIWDVTMSSRESTESRITDLRAAGYERIDGVFWTSRWRQASAGPMTVTGASMTPTATAEGWAAASFRPRSSAPSTTQSTDAGTAGRSSRPSHC